MHDALSRTHRFAALGFEGPEQLPLQTAATAANSCLYCQRLADHTNSTRIFCCKRCTAKLSGSRQVNNACMYVTSGMHALSALLMQSDRCVTAGLS